MKIALLSLGLAALLVAGCSSEPAPGDGDARPVVAVTANAEAVLTLDKVP